MLLVSFIILFLFLFFFPFSMLVVFFIFLCLCLYFFPFTMLVVFFVFLFLFLFLFFFSCTGEISVPLQMRVGHQSREESVPLETEISVPLQTRVIHQSSSRENSVPPETDIEYIKLQSKVEISVPHKTDIVLERVLDGLLEEVKRLHACPDWLPIERCRISFYHDKLVSFYQELQSFTSLTHSNRLYDSLNDTRLNTLVSRILEFKDTRTSVVNSNDPPPDLALVGDQLAVQMDWIYSALNQYPRDFAHDFHFDSKMFQDEEVFVGFQVEADNLLQQLASITKKRLEVISIVGMAGLGKTTLATRLYNDPYVTSYFYVRAWVTFSQVYRKRDVLLVILRSVVEITDEICKMDDSMLAHALYQALKGRRYFIVIDDIWSSKAWDDFKACFPDDNNGSKIMLTTRLKDVALHANSDGNPLCLRFLTEEESFELFRRKAFVTGTLFDYLSSVGKRITRKCRGLPLAIVVIAGLLKHKLEINWWKQVEESVSSYIVADENQYLDTLALSYDHLPQHLRPCFLCFGAFPEDQDIPVRKLIWLWIAEGFISQDGTQKSLEDVADDYLMNLISRSLVVVGKKRYNGAIKTCRIHDLLRDLCLKKAEELNFSPYIYRFNKHSYSCPHSFTNSSTQSQLFLCTNDVLAISSNCSCYSSEVSHSFFKDVSIVWDTSKVIRALDISSIELFGFPSELLQLVHLRYLELRFRSGNPPESISNLGELQTLIMSSRMNMFVPKNVWKMINLRHLSIKSGENRVHFSHVEEEPILLENMLSMSLLSPTRPFQNILASTRNLQELGLCGPLTTKSGDLKFPDLGLLTNLEKLKLLNTIPLSKATRLSTSITFPGSLKHLTVSNTYLDWREAWLFEMIPNLEVLKLIFHAFVGKDWETSPKAFPRLKVLKLDELDIVNWTASRDHFPMIQRLQVYRCPYLMEIPEDFGNIFTLEWIELSGCSDATISSARDIQTEQEMNGNDSLKILLNPGPTRTPKPLHKKGRIAQKGPGIVYNRNTS